MNNAVSGTLQKVSLSNLKQGEGDWIASCARNDGGRETGDGL